MNKKILLALPVVAGVAGASWAGSTLYSSNESRDAYERILSDLNESTGFSFVTTSYAPGFLKSEATTEVRSSDEPDAIVLARLRHAIEHSPVGTGVSNGLSAARVTTTFVKDGAADDVTTMIFEAFGGAEPVTLLSSIGFTGTVSNELTVAAFRAEMPDGEKISSDGGVWNFDVNDKGSVSGSGTWSGFNLTSPKVNITVSASHDVFNYTRLAPAAYSGNYEVDLAEIVVNSPATGINLGVRDLGMSATSDIQNGLLTSDYALWVNDIDAPIALDSARFTASVGGIDINTLENARDVANRTTFADTDSMAKEEATVLVKELVSAYGTMIQPGAHLGYGLTLGNAGGEADADIKVTFDGDGSPSGYDLLTSPNATVGDLLNALRVDMNMDAPGEVLGLTPVAMFLDPTAFAPWIVDNAGSLSSNIVVDDLVIDVNGEPMALGMMIGDALYEPLDLDKLLEL